MDNLLEPVDEPVVAHRKPTEGSLYAEGILLAFVRSGADKARVRVEDTPYKLDELYALCRNTARKRTFVEARVSASKNNGRLLLIRKRSPAKEGG